MNAFYEHHKDSIQFGYRCFDRMLLNAAIQPFRQPERVLSFFNTYREGTRVTKRVLTQIADQFQNWLTNRSEKWGAPVVDAPEEERRDEFVQEYLEHAEADHVAVILKAREPARILVAIGGEKHESPHLEYKQRWVNQFNFYVNDERWGRMRNARKRVRTHVSLLSVPSAGVSEPTPLAGNSDARRGNRFSADNQRVPQMW